MNNCKHCHLPFEKLQSHSKFCDKNPRRQENLEKLRNARESITSEARNKINSGVREAWKRGSYEDSCKNSKKRSGRKHSEESKALISEKRKAWLRDNPDCHPWRKSSKFKSEPCERLKKLLAESSISFVEELSPIEGRFFSIDIAFPEINLGIEVNGEQHYNRDGTLKKYYQERHDLIESKGWKLIELRYTECYNPDIVDKIILTLGRTGPVS